MVTHAQQIDEINSLERQLREAKTQSVQSSIDLSRNQLLHQSYIPQLGIREKYFGGYFGGNQDIARNARATSQEITRLEKSIQELNAQQRALDKEVLLKITAHLRGNDVEYQRLEHAIANVLSEAKPILTVSETDISFFGGTYARSLRGKLDAEGYFVAETIETDLSFFDGTYPQRLAGYVSKDGEVVLEVTDTDLSFFGGTFPRVMSGAVQANGSMVVTTTETDVSFLKGTYVRRMSGDLFGGDESKRKQYSGLQHQKEGYVTRFRKKLSDYLL